MTLPCQALRCHLAGVSAARVTGFSQTDVIQAMWKLVAGRPLLAVVKVNYWDLIV